MSFFKKLVCIIVYYNFCIAFKSIEALDFNNFSISFNKIYAVKLNTYFEALKAHLLIHFTFED